MPLLGSTPGSYFSGERPGQPKQLACGELPELTITGKLTGGKVWGSNPYTSDSDWAVAAVHAGLCAVGETIKIQRHTPSNYAPYKGSTKNSVTTTDWNTEWCGYYIKLAGTTNPCGPYPEATITGSNKGIVYGSNPYVVGTDDATAAVHAGLCAVGETITIERYNPGLHAPYTGSNKNGITSKEVLATNKCGYYIKKKEVNPKKVVYDFISRSPQIHKVPDGVTLLKAKIWGAGGGGGKIRGLGGGGGYVYVEFPVTPGEELQIFVGQGGYPSGVTFTSASGYVETTHLPPLAFDSSVGEGAAGTGGMSGWPYESVTGGMNVWASTVSPQNPWIGYNSGAGGGGASGILRPSVPEWIAMAGGGGGAGDLGSGGPGGGADGGQGENIAEGGGGYPGTVASGPGKAGNGLYASVGIPGEPTGHGNLSYIPSAHLRGGGGGIPLSGLIGGGGQGGSGYWGGGAGGPLTGGGGGSGYVKAGLVNTTDKGTPANFESNLPPSIPGNFVDPERDYKGTGGMSARKARYDKFYGIRGQDGRVIVWYD